MTGFLALAPKWNTAGKKDATGAFQPEAQAWLEAMGYPEQRPILIDNKQPAPLMRASVLKAIVSHLPDVLGIFCHGWSTGIQFWTSLRQIDELADAIHVEGDFAPRVVLYCCSTGKGAGVGGDGGFADSLRDALCNAGDIHCRVDAHTTVGHCSRNPYVRRFEGSGSASGGRGGAFLVQPGTELWPKWADLLRNTDLRYRYPLMTVEAIHAEVAQRRGGK